MKKIDQILQGKAAIFDVDGTLIDSMDIWRDAGELYLKQLNIEAEQELAEKLFSMSLEDSADYMKEKYHLPGTRESIVAHIVKIVEHAYFYDVPVKSGVKQVLQSLKEHKIPMVIATSSNREVVEAALKRLDILEYFEKIYTCSEVGIGKNHPDIYNQAAEYLRQTPENIWVFEDSLYAAKTAKTAGFQLVGVYDDSCREKQLDLQSISDIYVHGMEELF